MQVYDVSIPYLVFFRHRGICICYWDGSSRVYACSPRAGVSQQSLKEFADGYAVSVSPAKTRLLPDEVVAQAESMLARPYDGASWNCDHFVEYALGNRVESRQVQVVIIGLVALALARLAMH